MAKGFYQEFRKKIASSAELVFSEISRSIVQWNNGNNIKQLLDITQFPVSSKDCRAKSLLVFVLSWTAKYSYVKHYQSNFAEELLGQASNSANRAAGRYLHFPWIALARKKIIQREGQRERKETGVLSVFGHWASWLAAGNHTRSTRENMNWLKISEPANINHFPHLARKVYFGQ